MNYYPIILPKNLSIKSKNDGLYLQIRDLGDIGITLNQTASNIFKHCDGKHSISDIVEFLNKEFNIPESNNDTIFRDVMNTLKEINKYGILAWKSQDNPFLKKHSFGDISITEITLDTLYLLHKNFKYTLSDSFLDIEKNKNLEYFKHGIFSNILKFLYVEKCNKPVLLTKFQLTDYTKIWNLFQISYNEELSSEDYNAIFSHFKEILKNGVYKESNISEFGVSFHSDKDPLILKDMNFKQIAKLDNEILNTTVNLFMKTIIIKD